MVTVLHSLLPLFLPLDLSDLPHQEADLIAIEFGNRGESVDVLDEVFGCAQECLERSLAIATTEDVAIRRDEHFDQPGRRPVFTEQAAQDRLEVVADLYGPELACAVPANLVGFTDGVSSVIIFLLSLMSSGATCIMRSRSQRSQERTWRSPRGHEQLIPGSGRRHEQQRPLPIFMFRLAG